MIRILLKFAPLAAGMILLLAAVQWVRAGPKTYTLSWDQLDQLVRGTLIYQCVTDVAVSALLAQGQTRPGRSLAIVLAVGLAGTGLVGATTVTSAPDVAYRAEVLGLAFALGLVFALAAVRRWIPFWLTLVALLGSALQVTELVLLARSFM